MAGSWKEEDSNWQILLYYLAMAQHQPTQANSPILNPIHAQKKEKGRGKKKKKKDWAQTIVEQA